MAWKDLDQQSGGVSGRFVSFKDGGAKRFRLLDEEPYTTYAHKISQKVNGEEVFRSIPATLSLDDDYIQQENGTRYPAEAIYNMRGLEYAKDESGKRDTDEGELKVLQGGRGIFKELRGLYEQFGSLSQFDIIITKTGEGRDTKYSVSAAPKSFDVNIEDLVTQMEGDETLQWENIFRPITAEDQKKMLADAKLDVHYDPAAELMESMTFEDAKNVRFTFGKYKDKKLSEIAAIDSGYLEWAADKVTSNDEVAAGCRIIVQNLGELEAAPAKALPSSKAKAEPAAAAAKKTTIPPKSKTVSFSDDERAEMKTAIEEVWENWEATDIVASIKKASGGKARMKDLTDGEFKELHDAVVG